MTEQLEAAALARVAEAMELRHGAAGDPDGPIRIVSPSEGFSEVNQMLVRIGRRSDRVDELLAHSTLARGVARRALEQAQFDADEAMFNATRANQSRRVEFESALEKKAEAALGSFNERRLAFQRERLVSVTNDAYEVISQIHWSLDSIKKDLRATLHALQFESSMDH